MDEADTFGESLFRREKIPVKWHEEHIWGEGVCIVIRWAENLEDKDVDREDEGEFDHVYRKEEVETCDVCSARAEGKMDGTNLCGKHMDSYATRFM